MAGYFVHENYIIDGINVCPGVQKKVQEQIKVLELQYEMHEIFLDPKPNTLMNKLLRRMPWGSNNYDWDGIADQIVDPDFIYIRKPLLDSGSHQFLKQVRKKYPHTQILLEIPTFPYDKEILINVQNVPIYLKEVYYRKRLYKTVDRIVTLSQDKEIFGLETIYIQNGIDVEKHPVKKTKEDLKDIHLLAVAIFQKAHGYERIIRGMAEYYKAGGTRNIVLDMVGDGDELALYQELTNSLGMNDHVVFWGRQYGDALTDIFDRADIGLAPFGFYKHNVVLSSALKIREYIARGLPVAAGSRQDLFTEETFPYYLEFPNDDSTVDMNRIIAFYDRIYSGTAYETVINEVRMYAEKNVTWKRTFGAVAEYLEAQTTNTKNMH